MLLNALKIYGVDLVRILQSVRGIPKYFLSYLRFRSVRPKGWPIRLRPYLSDFYDNSGRVTTHYFKQDIFVAREIYQRKPKRHIDIGSRVDGFISHLAVFTEVEVIDIRGNNKIDPRIKFIQADICKVTASHIGTTESISCLHTIEHIGLARYGDPIGSTLWIEAVDRIFGLLSAGGVAYLSTPIGLKRLEFNAQRIYDLEELLGFLQQRGAVEKVAIINDQDELAEYIDIAQLPFIESKQWKFGCGIFVIRKPAI